MKRQLTNTDAQVTAMLADAVLWRDALRIAANERGAKLSSVADWDRVFAFLRGFIDAPAKAKR